MNKLMNPPKINHWRFTNSTGLRQTIIVADTPEEAKKIFKEKCIKDGQKWKYYDYSLGYNCLQQDFLQKERDNA
tara:strand:- start:36 stop:257 length:222 start_codon:yes stop_codon:yes gene_type:complete